VDGTIQQNRLPAGPATPASIHAASVPATTELAPATAADARLVAGLLRNGILTADGVQTALRHAAGHKTDLRQAIQALGLIPLEVLTTLAFERLQALADANGAAVPAVEPQIVPPSVPAKAGAPPATTPAHTPDRTKRQLDIRMELKDLSGTASLPDLVAQILQKACESRATDIHVDPHERGLRIRYRIDGQLQDVLELDGDITAPLISRLKVISNLNIVDRRHSQDGRITFDYQNRRRDLRVATIPTSLGEKLVIRIHELMLETTSLEHLGMNARQAEQLEKLIAKPYGAILVAGPVGAGKSTTLYTCVTKVNSPTRNLMTIEDPIEKRIAGVNQTQVDTRSDMGFSEGLKAMLRQDPDVIMIGEIRDEETAGIGIRAAMTGVLVFSTIHGSDCASTIGNLYNFGIPGYQLSNSLLAIVSQRLIRKICPYCKVTTQVEPKVLRALEIDPDEHGDLTIHRGVGCPSCFQTGYLGRTGIFEIMEVTDELRELIFQQIPKDVLRRMAVDLGLQTLKQSAVDKILEGTTTVEEAYRVVSM
jgi:type II secretory ATPase GspE/PulE/Tfp pilus assembly ATPase PilB-like protein